MKNIITSMLLAASPASQEAPYLSYFPLDDGTAGGGTPYFEPVYKGGYGEGFISAICTEVLTAVNGPNAQNSGFGVVHTTDGFAITGLPLGRYTGVLHDAAGRVVQREELHGGAMHAWKLSVTLAPGVYVLAVPGIGAERVIVH
ncbi:MAG: hypothetical protein IPJ76_10595 [Flavobacteriales bacterium]|nr:MAG: hypothetical protein IPJ76_10595 [Flavobacteriales bacterium]